MQGPGRAGGGEAATRHRGAEQSLTGAQLPAAGACGSPGYYSVCGAVKNVSAACVLKACNALSGSSKCFSYTSRLACAGAQRNSYLVQQAHAARLATTASVGQ